MVDGSSSAGGSKLARAGFSTHSAPFSSHWIERPRLFTCLDELMARPVVWLSAGAGFGKTVLAASYLGKRQHPVLWHRLDERDGEPGSFFHSLKEAALGWGLRPVEEPLPPRSGQPRGAELAYTRTFIETLYEGAPPGFVLVLDDFEQVPAVAPLQELLPVILESVQRAGGLFVLSRHGPPPEVARLRASRHLSLLEEEELRLTPAETKALVASTAGPDRPDEAIRVLHDRLHGWAAGTVLALECLGRRVDCDFPATAGDRVIFDYFATELFSDLDPDTRRLLQLTSLPPYFDVFLAERLSGSNQADHIISRLLHHNLFLYEKGDRYRYHPLFRAFLLQSIQAEWSVEQRSHHLIEAAQALLEREEVDLALPLLRSAGGWDRFVAALLGAARTMMAQGRHRELEAYIRSVPTEMRIASPWLDLWLATATLPEDFATSYELFSSVYTHFESQEDRQGALFAWVGAVDSIALSLSDMWRFDAWLSRYERMVAEGWEELERSELKGALASRLLIICMLRHPGHRMLDSWRREVHQLLPTLEDRTQRALSFSYLFSDCMSRGRLGEAAALLDGMEGRDTCVSTLEVIAIHWSRAWLAWALGRHDDCIAAYEEGLARSERSGLHGWKMMLWLQGITNALVHGDVERADALLSRSAADLSAASELDRGYYYNHLAWSHLLRGDVLGAWEHLQVALHIAESVGSVFSICVIHLGMAHAQEQMGAFDQARRHLDQARVMGASFESWAMELRLGLAEAHLALMEDYQARCLEIIGPLLDKAQRFGVQAFEWWRRDAIARVCAVALEHDVSSQLVLGIIQRFELDPPEDVGTSKWPWPVRIRTMGRFELEVEGSGVDLSGNRHRRPCELLRLLVVSGPRGAAEATLADTLWPGLEGDAAIRNLRTNLHRLRRLLACDRAILVSQGRMWLNPKVCWSDDAELDRLLGKLSSCPPDRLPEAVRQILALGLEPFLPEEEGGLYVQQRSSLEKRIPAALVPAIERLEVGGHGDLAGELSLRLDGFLAQSSQGRLRASSVARSSS